MKITVIGLGLIGGSIAKDLKSQLNVDVCGVDASEDHMKQALELGLVHSVADLEVGIQGADMVIISIPVNKIEGLLPRVLDQIGDKTTVIDVGSTKDDICKTVSKHPDRKDLWPHIHWQVQSFQVLQQPLKVFSKIKKYHL